MSLDKWWGKRMSSTWNVWGSDETEKVLVCKSYVRVEGQSGVWIFVFSFAFAFSFVLVKNILDESEQVEVCRTCLAEVVWGWRGSQPAQEEREDLLKQSAWYWDRWLSHLPLLPPSFWERIPGTSALHNLWLLNNGVGCFITYLVKQQERALHSQMRSKFVSAGDSTGLLLSK